LPVFTLALYGVHGKIILSNKTTQKKRGNQMSILNQILVNFFGIRITLKIEKIEALKIELAEVEKIDVTSIKAKLAAMRAE
jgi:hypothetical protein